MIDNGGAVAIKGFNYQKTSAIYTIILHRKNESFNLIPEADDDFQFEVDSNKYYVQAKSSKNLSVSKLYKRDKEKKDIKNSILEKNLKIGDDLDVRIIYLCYWNMSDGNKLIKTYENEILQPLHKFTDKQKENIIKLLDFDNKESNRLNNQRIFQTPFKNNTKENLIYLNGLILNTIEDEELLVSNSVLTSINGELVTVIDQNSEIEIQNPTEPKEYELKIIDHSYISTVFKRLNKTLHYERILDSLNFNELIKLKIKSAKNKAEKIYSHLILELVNILSTEAIESLLSNKEIIDYIKNKTTSHTDIVKNDYELTAIAIECFSRILAEEE